MSTATNGAATEAAFKAIVKATKDAATTVIDTGIVDTRIVDTVASAGPSVEQVSGEARDSTQVWLAASTTITGLSLHAYNESVRAYLDYTKGVAAASMAAWAIELAQSNTKIVSELASNYSNAARALFNK